MLKYKEIETGFNIIPNEYTICFHMCTSYQEEGTKMFIKPLGKMLEANHTITCFCIDGGNLKTSVVTYLAQYVYKHFPHLNIAWINHSNTIPNDIKLDKLHYIVMDDKLYKRDLDSAFKTFEKSWDYVGKYSELQRG